MEVTRFNPKVDTFSYYSTSRAEQVLDTISTVLKVGLTPLQLKYPATYGDSSVIGTRLDFTFPLEEFVVTGSISQVNTVMNRSIEHIEDLSAEEVNELILPLFDTVQRLTYDVSEIALDEPGISLDFEQLTKESQ